MLRRIASRLLLAVVAALAACDGPADPSAAPAARSGPPSLAAAVVHDRLIFTEPFNQVALSECLGEPTLTITGTFREEFITSTRVGDPRPYRYELNDVIRGTAVGSSGTQYKFLVNEHQTLSTPDLESTHFTFSFPSQIRLIGTGSAPDRIIHFTEHLTILPSGVPQVDILDVRAICHS